MHNVIFFKVCIISTYMYIHTSTALLAIFDPYQSHINTMISPAEETFSCLRLRPFPGGGPCTGQHQQWRRGGGGRDDAQGQSGAALRRLCPSGADVTAVV